jgi:hypothetical protein
MGIEQRPYALCELRDRLLDVVPRRHPPIISPRPAV